MILCGRVGGCHWGKEMPRILARAVLSAALWAIACAAPAYAAPAADDARCPVTVDKVKSWLADARDGEQSPPWQRFAPSTAAEGYCSFYELGWRSFLYLMQEVEAGGTTVPRFITWKRSDQTFPPVVDLGGSRYGLAFQPQAWDGSPNPPQTGPINKSTVLIEQARPQFPLYTPEHLLTEFGVRVNRPGYAFAVCQNLYTQGCFDQRISAHDAKPITLPRSSAEKEGAVELKLSWLAFGPSDRQACEDRSFYCTRGFDRFGRPAVIGMVGMHITVFHQSVPSGIWITFEHYANAPDCDGGSKLDDRNSWTFSDAPADASHWQCPSASFAAKTGTDSRQSCSLDAHGHTIDADGRLICNCRGSQEAAGLPPPDSDPSPAFVCRTTPVDAKTAALNDDVVAALRQLASAAPYLDDYRLMGVVWNDPSQPNTANATAIGSTWLTNSTMETYVQTLNFKPLGCFGCHRGDTPTTKNRNPALNAFHTISLVNGVDRSFFFDRIDASTLGYCPSPDLLPEWCRDGAAADTEAPASGAAAN